MENKEREPFYKRIKKTIMESYWNIVLLVAMCTFVAYAIWNWKEFVVIIGNVISVLMPFIIAVLLAYLIMPLVNVIEKCFQKVFFRGRGRKICRIISVILSYIIVVGLITLTLIYVIPEITKTISEMDFKKMYDSAMVYIHDLQKKFPILNTESINEKLEGIQPTLINYGTNAAKFIFPAIYSLSMSIVSVIINILLSIVISCYIVIDKKNIKVSARRVVFAMSPKGKADSIWKTLKECNHIFNGFLTGKMIDSIIIGIICFIVMSIMRMPYASLISLVVGITNMIPYFGPFIGAVPGVLIYLLTDPKLALIFAILILAIQQFDGLYLGPKILGDQTGLKPLWVIFAITVGGAYFGVLGMFLGVPVVAVFAYLLNKFVQRELDKKKISNI